MHHPAEKEGLCHLQLLAWRSRSCTVCMYDYIAVSTVHLLQPSFTLHTVPDTGSTHTPLLLCVRRTVMECHGNGMQRLQTAAQLLARQSNPWLQSKVHLLLCHCALWCR